MSFIRNSVLTRFDSETDTCDRDTLYNNFLDGFLSKFQDSFFYTFIIQFIIVTLMHVNVGKGKYWRVLFYAALAGLCGSLIENGTVSEICLRTNETKKYSVIPTFLLCEIFWIPSEYAIPYLNLIKMEAFSKGKLAKSIKYSIIGLGIPFVIFRVLIGYERMKKGYLQDPKIHTYHGGAFFIMALADILCTFCILYFVKKHNNQCALTSNINNYIKHSSYTILVAVDIVSTILSILNIFCNMERFRGKISDNIVKPLHCLKCSFILILAADALIFKYGANVSSIHESSGNNSKTYGNGGTDSNTNYNFSSNFKSTLNKSRNNFSVNDITSTSFNLSNSTYSKGKNSSRQSAMINVSPYNYPVESDTIYSRSPDSTAYSTKTIVKNYTNFKTPTSSHEQSQSNESDKTLDIKVYPNQTFGFLNQ